MKVRNIKGISICPASWVTALAVLALAAIICSFWMPSFAAETSLLTGRVTSDGKPVPGAPVKARLDGSSITVSAYTNGRGDYSFPDWSHLTAGSHSITIELPEFTSAKREGVMLSAGKTARLDFALESRAPTIADATQGEIASAMPGTEDQKFLLSQCGQCHSLQLALRTPRDRETWLKTVRRMAGARRAEENPPGTRAFDQKKYVEPLADYLATVRGPGAPKEIPFKLRPRPTGDASTQIVVTEFEIPRGGKSDLYITRGDRRFAWPHDVAIDPNGQYVWYTDHFTDILGRLDRKTGEVKEFPFTPARRKGARSAANAEDPTGPEDGRAGEPGGGSHKILFAPDGNLIFGTGSGTIIFDPKTEQFKVWPSGSVMFGISRNGDVWYLDRGNLNRLNTKTGEVKSWPAPANAGGYDVEIDALDRFVYNGWRTGIMGVFNPETQKFTEYPVPTPGAGPRRGEFDAKNRYWTALYYGGRLAMFDPGNGKTKEYALLPDVKPFGPPYLAPYSVSVDDKNQFVWTTDLNSSRVYRLNMKTEKMTEFYMPAHYELRDITVDRFASRPTVWLPAYRPQSRIVSIEMR